MADIDEGALSRVTDDETPWEKGMVRAKVALGLLAVASLVALFFVVSYASNARDATDFSVHLAGYDGLNATTTLISHTHTAAVSPVFALKVRVENPRRVLQPWCYDGGGVTVSYADVALASGDMPRFCVKRRLLLPMELNVVAVGREVGLSEDLRGRLASELQAGTAQIMVDMKLFVEGSKSPSPEYQGPSLHPFQLTL